MFISPRGSWICFWPDGRIDEMKEFILDRAALGSNGNGDNDGKASGPLISQS